MSTFAGQLTAKYMFSLLDYRTYNIFAGDQWIAQVVLNSTDRTVTLTLGELGVDPYRLGQIRSYARWVTWIQAHISV